MISSHERYRDVQTSSIMFARLSSANNELFNATEFWTSELWTKSFELEVDQTILRDSRTKSKLGEGLTTAAYIFRNLETKFVMLVSYLAYLLSA